MFETVVPETVAPRSRKLLYETLPLSVAVHLLAAGGLLILNVWDVKFPMQSPKMYAAYSLVEPPPPPPPPPPPAAPKQVQTAPKVPIKFPLVAPTIIPDTIPVISQIEEPPPPLIPVVTEAAPVAGGVEAGEEGGMIGGIIGGLKAQPLPDLVKIERDLPLPMGSVSQEFPTYPEYARTRGWEDVVVVRYLIGKNGKVKEVTVIQPPQREEFARAAVEAIRHWRFHPFRDVNGEAKEVVHELTVKFTIVRRAGVR
jgi:protein TonB